MNFNYHHEAHEAHEGHEVGFDAPSNRVIGLAIEVHRELGPGLLESTYEKCLSHELEANNIDYIPQKSIPVIYKGMPIDCGYRIDLMIENKLIIELKCVDALKPYTRHRC